MIDLESLVRKTMELEARYYDLLSTHQSLVHEYEKLSNRYTELCKRQLYQVLNEDRT